VAVANHAGYEAHHVVHLGLQGKPDEILMQRVREQEFTFVTNNLWTLNGSSLKSHYTPV